MAAVYILFSRSLDRFYIGSCKDLAHRLELHASKEFRKSFTTRADDWELHLSIDVLDNTKARLIENHIKRMKSRAYIENLKKYPELVQKLVAKYS